MSVYSRCLKDSPGFFKLIEESRADKQVANRDLLSFLIMPVSILFLVFKMRKASLFVCVLFILHLFPKNIDSTYSTLHFVVGGFEKTYT